MEAGKQRTLNHRALLALLLWTGFWVLGLTLAGALFWIPVAQSLYQGDVSAAGWLAGLGGGAVLWALRPRGWFTGQKEEEPRALERAAFPVLHAFLDETARTMGAAPPDEVRLISHATAFIQRRRRWLGHGRLTIGLGLPLFAMLSRDELASVLAHEFGHRAAGDLRLGPWVHRTRSAIASAIDSLDDSAFFLDVPFRAYGRIFLSVSGSVSREQELAADGHAARLYGASPTVQALRKVHELGARWDVYLELDAIPTIELGCRPPVVEGFRRFLAQRVLRQDVCERLDAAAERRPSSGDTHPSLGERLAALHASADAARAFGVSALEPNCLDLLGGEQAAEAAWFERVTNRPLPDVPWEEVGSKLLLPKLVKAFIAVRLEPATIPLERFPDRVRHAGEVWDQVRPPGPSFLSPAAQRKRGLRALEDWLSSALFVRGFTPEVRPGASLRLSRDTLAVTPSDVVRDLESGALDEASYRRQCSTWEGPGSPGVS